MLKERVITACMLFVGLALVLLFLPYSSFSLVVTAVFVIAAWEWAGMVGLIQQWQRILYAAVFALIFFVLFTTSVTQHALQMLVLLSLSMFGWLLALFATWRYPEGKCWNKQWFLGISGLWLLVPAWLGLLILQLAVARGGLIWLVIATIAAADIGAYFAGRHFGKHKLAIHVSPGKTWEGFWGGALINVLLAMALALFLDLHGLQFFGFVAVLVLTAAVSVLGDLFESMIKRERGIKDSSKLLPGHGGVLDRIDGWTAAVPLFTLLYLLYGRAL